MQHIVFQVPSNNIIISRNEPQIQFEKPGSDSHMCSIVWVLLSLHFLSWWIPHTHFLSILLNIILLFYYKMLHSVRILRAFKVLGNIYFTRCICRINNVFLIVHLGCKPNTVQEQCFQKHFLKRILIGGGNQIQCCSCHT